MIHAACLDEEKTKIVGKSCVNMELGNRAGEQHRAYDCIIDITQKGA